MNSAQISFKATDTANHVTEQVYENINPAATPTQIRDFVQSLDDLSDDTYSKKSITVRDVVMSTTPDTKIPTCYIRRLTAWDGEDEIQSTASHPKNLPGTVMSYWDFSDFVIGEGSLFCTASDATPYVSKLPDDATLVFTDVTDWIKARAANLTNYQQEKTTVAALSTKSHFAEYIASLPEETSYSDEQIARIKQEISDTLFELKFWRINCIATKGEEHGGEYIISLPATAKYSATNFSFTVTPAE